MKVFPGDARRAEIESERSFGLATVPAQHDDVLVADVKQCHRRGRGRSGARGDASDCEVGFEFGGRAIVGHGVGECTGAPCTTP